MNQFEIPVGDEQESVSSGKKAIIVSVSIMTAVLELQHNGKSWVLIVTPEQSEGLSNIEISVTDEIKQKLEMEGCEIYSG